MNNNIRYKSKSTKDLKNRSLHRCLKLSIATGSLYVLALVTGFVYSNYKPRAKEKTATESVYDIDDIKTVYEQSQYPGFEGYSRVTSLSTQDLKLYTGSDNLQSFNIKCTPNEYLELLNEETTTYENVLFNELELNPNLDAQTKTLINDFIKYRFNGLTNRYAPYVVLKNNLSKVQITEVFDDKKPLCKFDPFTCTICINKSKVVSDDDYNYAILLGIIGYGMTSTYDEIDGKKVFCSTTEYYYREEENDIVKLGTTFENGVAAATLSRVSGQIISANNDLYEDTYIFGTIQNILAHLSFEYSNNGYTGLLDELSMNPDYKNMLYIIKNFDIHGEFNPKLETTINIYDVYLAHLKKELQAEYADADPTSDQIEAEMRAILALKVGPLEYDFTMEKSGNSSITNEKTLWSLLDPTVSMLFSKEKAK